MHWSSRSQENSPISKPPSNTRRRFLKGWALAATGLANSRLALAAACSADADIEILPNKAIGTIAPSSTPTSSSTSAASSTTTFGSARTPKSPIKTASARPSSTPCAPSSPPSSAGPATASIQVQQNKSSAHSELEQTAMDKVETKGRVPLSTARRRLSI